MRKMCDHKNIVGYYGASAHEGCVLVVMDIAPRGDLQAALKDEALELPWLRRMQISAGCAALPACARDDTCASLAR